MRKTKLRYAYVLKNLSKNIKVLRIANNLSVSELALRLGVSATTVRNWEKNPTNLYSRYLIRLSRTFGISIESLVEKKIKIDNKKH